MAKTKAPHLPRFEIAPVPQTTATNPQHVSTNDAAPVPFGVQYGITMYGGGASPDMTMMGGFYHPGLNNPTAARQRNAVFRLLQQRQGNAYVQQLVSQQQSPAQKPQPAKLPKSAMPDIQAEPDALLVFEPLVVTAPKPKPGASKNQTPNTAADAATPGQLKPAPKVKVSIGVKVSAPGKDAATKDKPVTSTKDKPALSSAKAKPAGFAKADKTTTTVKADVGKPVANKTGDNKTDANAARTPPQPGATPDKKAVVAKGKTPPKPAATAATGESGKEESKGDDKDKAAKAAKSTGTPVGNGGGGMPGKGGGGGGGGGPTIGAWKAGVSGAAKKMETPKVNGAPGVAAVKKDGEAARDAAQVTADTLPDKGKAAVAKPPTVNEKLPNPVAKPDPVPEATKLVEAASNKKLPNQAMPDFEISPQQHMPRLGRPVPAPGEVTGEEGAQPTTPGAADAKDPLQKQVDQVNQAGEKQPDQADRAGEGKGIVLVDEGAPPKVELPPETKTQLAGVLAQLLADPKQEAAAILDEARQMAYPNGALKTEFPNFGDDDILPDLTTSLTEQLQGIAKEAGIAEKELKEEVKKRQGELKIQTDDSKQEIDAAAAGEKKSIVESGIALLDSIAGTRQALDENTERQLEAAKGEGDPQVIKSKRERLAMEVDRKVAKQVVLYDRAGKLREAQIEHVIGAMKPAYQQAARLDEKKLVEEATANKKDVKAAQLVAAESYNWADRWGRKLDQEVLDRKKDVTKWVKEYQDGIKSAGTGAKTLIRAWADARLDDHMTWLRGLLDIFRDWVSEAKTQSEEWASASNADAGQTVINDLANLNMVALSEQDGVDLGSEAALEGLSREEKAIYGTYFKAEPGQRNSLAAVAAGLRVRLSTERLSKIKEKFESKLEQVPDAEWEKLERICQAANPGFKGAHRADEIYQALHGGVTGWNEEGRAFEALSGLGKLESITLHKAYKFRHELDLDDDLESELRGDEEKRALAQAKGDQSMADAAALRYAMKGGWTGTFGADEDPVFQILRGKTAEERQKIKEAYKKEYGTELEADLEDEMGDDEHENQRKNALLEGDTSKADAIAIDRALRGGITGWGQDLEDIEGIHKQIRQETIAQMEAEAKASGKDVTTAEIEAEIAKRNRQVESSYNTKYKDDWKVGPGQSALRKAYDDEFGTNIVEDPKGAYVKALLDNNVTLADAAKFQIEKKGVYADDDVMNGLLEKQYDRALEETRRDKGPALRREMEKRAKEDGKNGHPWDPFKWKEEERAFEKQLEEQAKVRSKKYMDDLADTYDTNFGNQGPGFFNIMLKQNMSGTEEEKALRLREQNGYLSPTEKIHYATVDLGTKGEEVKKALDGKTKDEIDAMDVEWRKTHNGESLYDHLDSETSGRLWKEIQWKLKGEPKNATEKIELMREQAAYEEKHGSIFAGHQRDVMRKDLEALEKKYALVTEIESDQSLTPAEREKERVKRLQQFMQIAGHAESSVQHHKEQVETVADTVVTAVVTTVAVVAAAVAIFFSGGTATPAVIAAVNAWIGAAAPAVLAAGQAAAAFMATAGGAAAVAGGTALLGVGTRYAMLGSSYSGEAAAKELAVGAVEALAALATANIGGRLLALHGALAKSSLSAVQKAEIAALMAGGEAAKKQALAKMAEGGVRSRLFAHFLANGVESAVGSMPGSVATTVLDDNFGKSGNKIKAIGTAVGKGAGQQFVQGGLMAVGTAVVEPRLQGALKNKYKAPPDPSSKTTPATKVTPKDTNTTTKETTVAPVEKVVTSKETVIPSKETVIPPKEKVIPPQETVVPPKEKVIPQKETVVPSKETVDPAKETTIPPEEKIFAPEEKVVGSKETVVKPEETVVTPKEKPVTTETPGVKTTPQITDESVSKMSGSIKGRGGVQPSTTVTTPLANKPIVTPGKRLVLPGTPEYHRMMHEAWSHHMRTSQLEPSVPKAIQPTGPPFTKDHFTFRDKLKTPHEAHDAFNEALMRANGREVGIYRNYDTGEYIVNVGDAGSVRKLKQGKWHTVLHYHPNTDNVLTYRLPSPTDIENTWNRVANSTGDDRHPITEFIEYPLPDGRRGRTAYTVTPSTPDTPPKITVEYIDADGQRVTLEYDHPLLFEKEHGSRSRFLFPSEEASIRADVDEWLRSRRKGEITTPPQNPMSGSIKDPSLLTADPTGGVTRKKGVAELPETTTKTPDVKDPAIDTPPVKQTTTETPTGKETITDPASSKDATKETPVDVTNVDENAGVKVAPVTPEVTVAPEAKPLEIKLPTDPAIKKLIDKGGYPAHPPAGYEYYIMRGGKKLNIRPQPGIVLPVMNVIHGNRNKFLGWGTPPLTMEQRNKLAYDAGYGDKHEGYYYDPLPGQPKDNPKKFALKVIPGVTPPEKLVLVGNTPTPPGQTTTTAPGGSKQNALARDFASQKQRSTAHEKNGASKNYHEIDDALKTIAAERNWTPEDLAMVRTWAETMRMLYQRTGGGDPVEFVKSLIDRPSAPTKGGKTKAGKTMDAGYNRSRYDDFRRRLRKKVIEHVNSQPGKVQAGLLDQFANTQPDLQGSKGALFTNFQATKRPAFGESDSRFTDLPDAGIKITPQTLADGAVHLSQNLGPGKPGKGDYMFDNKAGQSFDPEQAERYSEILEQGKGTITAMDGNKYEGLIYRCQSKDDAIKLATKLDDAGLHQNIYVAYLTADGRHIFVKRNIPAK